MSGPFVNVRTGLQCLCSADEGAPVDADSGQDILVICPSYSGQWAKTRQKSPNIVITRWQQTGRRDPCSVTKQRDTFARIQECPLKRGTTVCLQRSV